MTVGEQIKRIRVQKGLTQKQVADACGMADSAIRKYESGIMRPKPLTVSRIAKALEVEPFVLTGGDFHYPITFTVPIGELQDAFDAMFGWDDIRKSISKSLDRLNDDGQQEAVKRVEELTEISRYRRQDGPQAPSPAPEGKDTTPAEKPTEGPEEGG